MTKGVNGISPIVALIVTLLVGFFCVKVFVGGHIFWGVVLAIITLDFAADLVLSFKKPKKNQE